MGKDDMITPKLNVADFSEIATTVADLKGEDLKIVMATALAVEIAKENKICTMRLVGVTDGDKDLGNWEVIVRPARAS